MDTLEKFWRDAPAGYVVCANTGTTKNMILRAITEGAKDIEGLKKAVQLCGDGSCASDNPSNASCSANSAALLSIYGPIFEYMKEGHSHDHEGSSCEEGSSGGCGDCKLCQ